MELRVGGALADCAIVMHRHDNVAVAKRDVPAGTVLTRDDGIVEVTSDVGAGHRFALVDIGAGEHVRQYGCVFGISGGIEQGALVSGANVMPCSADYSELEKKAMVCPPAAPEADQRRLSMTFKGYLRADGRAGTRNYYLVVPASMCASDVAVRLASEASEAVRHAYPNVDGVRAAAHTEGCGCDDGTMIDRYLLTLKNTVAHPNVGGALIVDLGCEKKSIGDLSEIFKGVAKAKPIDYISIQGEGGTGRTLRKGRKIILSRLAEVNDARRDDVPLSGLVIGTECGASDTFSGITANPLIGAAVDAVISAGGSGILSEVPEMIGAEAALVARMASRDVVKKFLMGLEHYKSLANSLGVSMDGNFVEANARGGLVNLALKSLGAVLKGGSSAIVDFLDYSEQAGRKGLSLMNGPGNDIESMTGLVAGGANIILFSTGQGTTEGSLIAPVIKIPSRTEVFERMDEDMDFDAGRLLTGEATLDGLASELVDLVVQAASGKKTRAEMWGKRSFQIWTAGKLSL
ncbi:MAG: UxaA family hydrolase [Thermodesulfobacteriota bacterium]